jgi:hypothetical protein
MTIFSSGMFVANASKTTTCNTIGTGTQLTKLVLNGSYSGKLLNSANTILATINFTFTTDTSKVPHLLTQADMTTKAASKTPSSKKGGGLPVQLGPGSIAGGVTDNVTIFTVSAPDPQNNPVEIQFQILSGTNQSISGAWRVTNTGSQYDQFAGTYTLTAA